MDFIAFNCKSIYLTYSDKKLQFLDDLGTFRPVEQKNSEWLWVEFGICNLHA